LPNYGKMIIDIDIHKMTQQTMSVMNCVL